MATKNVLPGPHLQYEVDEGWVDTVRTYNGDSPDLNRIIDGTENSGGQIILATQLALQRFNSTPPIIDARYTFANFPDTLLLLEATLAQLLRMSMFVDARNSIDVQDAGLALGSGVKSGIYSQMADNYDASVLTKTMAIKSGLNAEESYAVLLSPESFGYNGLF